MMKSEEQILAPFNRENLPGLFVLVSFELCGTDCVLLCNHFEPADCDLVEVYGRNHWADIELDDRDDDDLEKMCQNVIFLQL